jgi:hypothetical protein
LSAPVRKAALPYIPKGKVASTLPAVPVTGKIFVFVDEVGFNFGIAICSSSLGHY